MREWLLDILVCPLCKGELSLENAERRGDEIISGMLRCESCGVNYPVTEGIPDMVPPED